MRPMPVHRTATTGLNGSRVVYLSALVRGITASTDAVSIPAFTDAADLAPDSVVGLHLDSAAVLPARRSAMAFAAASPQAVFTAVDVGNQLAFRKKQKRLAHRASRFSIVVAACHLAAALLFDFLRGDVSATRAIHVARHAARCTLLKDDQAFVVVFINEKRRIVQRL